MKLRYLAIMLLLTGCVNQTPQVETVTVKVMVPVPCKVDLGPDPDYGDSDADLAGIPYPNAAAILLAKPLDPVALKQMGDNLLYIIARYRGGRDMRIARDKQKQAAINKCGELPH